MSLIDDAGTTLQAIASHGLTLKADQGAHTLKLPIGRAEDFSKPFDLLILFTKGFHTAAAIEAARHRLLE